MSTFDLTIVPNSISMSLEAQTALFPSALTASAQTLDRGGFKWRTVLTFNNKEDADRAVIMGLLARLRGQAHRLRIPVHDNPKQGAYGGTPLVQGGSQTGSTLVIDGCSNVTDWIKAGDYFSVEVNGEHELKMATQDLNTSGGGGTLNFEPALRDSPSNNAPIYVEDGTLPKPTGVFVLDGQTTGWSSKPHTTNQLSDFQLRLIEDVFATQ